MTHPFVEDTTAPDYTGACRCTCGMPKPNRLHTLPARSDDDRALEARRMGERSDNDPDS